MNLNEKHKNHHKRNKQIKWLVVAMLLTLSLVWFAGCGTDNDEAKDTGTPVVTGQEQNDNQDTTTDSATGQEDDRSNDGTATDGGSTGTDSDTGSGTAGNDGATTGDTGSDSNPDTTPATPASTCTIQINCKLLVGQDLSGTGLETLVPVDGIILGTTKVTLNPGDTVYDVTLRVTKAKKIHMSSQGSLSLGTIYIEAISNIYEKAYNSKSGWVYLINGTKPGVGCSLQKLKAGDKLVWAYSLNLGNDL